jgi:NAD(P)-dependent dehydrogenase (short-subunit alcohol dehydrogenase family)
LLPFTQEHQQICQTLCTLKIAYVLQVNSAGNQIPGSIETAKLEDYDKQMNTNARSVFVLTQLAIPHLLKTKGNIVNVSSVAGLRSVSNFCTSYLASQITGICFTEN